ncbi:unnamed protein product, partial [Allacma fusca]
YGHLNGPDILASDSQVLSKFILKFLHPPKRGEAYNLTNPDWQVDPSMGQSAVIRRLFKNRQTPGFFVECGALDGETRSNTLYLERVLSWKGLLVEADPINYEKLSHKYRQAFITPTCLSTKPYPTMVSFQQQDNQGKIAEVGVGYMQTGYVDVQCFPFETMMIAMNTTVIDYFSLDVEGAELDILRTIPFDRFDIKTLSVEFIHDAEGKVAIKDFMTGQGYLVHSEVTHPNWLANDFIFVKKTFFDTFTKSEKDSIRKDIESQSTNFGGSIVVLIDSNNNPLAPNEPLSADFFNDPV